MQTDWHQELLSLLYVHLHSSAGNPVALLQEISTLALAVEGEGGLLLPEASEWGQSLVVLFGSGAADEASPIRAARAAQALRAAALALRPADAPLPAIGGHCAEALLPVGPVAQPSDTDRQTLIEGAQAAAAQGGPGELIASPALFHHLRGHFDMEPRSPHPFATDAAPPTYFLVQVERERTFHLPHVAAEQELPLVGRTAALSELQRCYREALRGGTLHIVALSGEPGIGKSRLLHEFNRWIEEQPDTVRFFRGRLTPQAGDQPFALFRDLFAYRFGIQSNEGLGSVRAKLEQGIRAVVGGDAASRAAAIGHLLGYDFSDSPSLQGALRTPPQLRARAFEFIAEFFEAITTARSRAVRLMPSATGPLDRPLALLFLEDLQWADEGSLALIDALIERCGALPMLLVAVGRPGPWQALLAARSPQGLPQRAIALPPLERDAQRQLLAARLPGSPPLPAPLLALMDEGSGGNPLFLEEFIHLLAEEGILVAQGRAGPWRLQQARLAGALLPRSQRGLLEARFAALTAAERTLLQRASVLGRLFWDRALFALSDGTDGSVNSTRATLAALVERGLLWERRSLAQRESREYLFRNSLLRDVAYDTLLPPTRVAYHECAAEWLAEWSSAERGRWAALVAEQLQAAQRPTEAIGWFVEAARYARRSSLPLAACDYFQHALDLQQSAGQSSESARMTILAELAQLLIHQGELDEAEQHLEELRWRGAESQDLAAQVRAELALAQLCEERWAAPASLRHARAALALLDASGQPPTSQRRERVAALCHAGWALLRLGEAQDGLEMAEQALALGRSTGSLVHRESAMVHHLLGDLYRSTGEITQAQSHLEQAQGALEALEDQASLSRLLHSVGELSQLCGASDQAVAHFREARSLAHGAGLRRWERLCRARLAGALADAGECAAAHPLLDPLREAAPFELGLHVVVSQALTRLHLAEGALEAALEAALDGMGAAQHLGQPLHLGRAWRLLGQAAALTRQPPHDPAYCFDESLRLFQQHGLVAEEAATLAAWAAFERQRGQRSAAKGRALAAQKLRLRLGLPDPTDS